VLLRQAIDPRRRSVTLLDVDAPDLDGVIPSAGSESDTVARRKRERTQGGDAVGVRAVGHQGIAIRRRGLRAA
jgi:hypothetical protein